MIHFLSKNYLLISVLILVCGLLILLSQYTSKIKSRDTMTIVVMSSLIAVSRGLFFWLPQFKPITALIMITGTSLGCIPGMFIGMLSGFLSNFFFGQGPWTPFQILAWGLIGFASGYLGKLNKIVYMVVGFFLTFVVYGVVMNVASTIMFIDGFSISGFLIYEMSGMPMDLVHGISTVVFIYFLRNPIGKRVKRLKTKYGVFEEVY